MVYTGQKTDLEIERRSLVCRRGVIAGCRCKAVIPVRPVPMLRHTRQLLSCLDLTVDPAVGNLDLHLAMEAGE